MRTLKDYLNENHSFFESKLDETELRKMIITAANALGKSFTVDINIGGTSAAEESVELIIRNSMGHIIENVVAGAFETVYGSQYVKHVTPKEKVNKGENPSCDIILMINGEPCNIEIKAYKEIGNIKPTAGQWDADYFLCVKYSLAGNKVTIEEINCVNPGDNTDKAHIKVTREMINKGLTVKA